MSYFCPVDGTKLEAMALNSSQVFRCPQCGGEMVNYATLRKDPKRFDSMKGLWNAALQITELNGKTCPLCERHMTRVHLPNSESYVDICKPCQNIWLDKSEYELIPTNENAKNVPFDLYEGLSEKAKDELLAAQLEDYRRDRKEMESPMPRGWKLIPAFLGLPTEDEGIQISKMPIATWILASICVIVYLFTRENPDYYYQTWGFIANGPVIHSMITVFTSFFLHAGWWHLIGNMYFLVVFGDNVEDEIGSLRFLILIFLGNFFGTMLYALLALSSDIPSVGASAGISAVLAYYVVLFPRSYLRFLLFRFVPFKMQAYWFLVIWLIMQIINSSYQMRFEGGGVNALAHLGGAAVGLVWGIVMRNQYSRE